LTDTYAKRHWVRQVQGKNGIIEYPDAETLTYDFELLSYAAHIWRVSGASLPPTLEELLYRCKEWDSQVSVMRQAQEYLIDKRDVSKAKK
jgi:hypothetical protein